MSDMLAVLLGAGGGATSKVIAALSGGKLETGGTQGQMEGGDPFMAVLFSKLNAAGAQGAQSADPVDLAATLEEADPEPAPDAGAEGKEQMPLKALEQALLAAHWPAGEAAAMAGQMSQAAAMVSAAMAQTPAGSSRVETDDAVLAGLGPSTEAGGGKDARKDVTAKSTGLAASAAMVADGKGEAANAKAGVAETAADGQLLPAGRGGAESPQQSRAETMPAAASPATAGGVVQALAAQFQGSGTDAGGVASGQTGHALAAGISHGVGAVAEAHGRATASGVQMSIEAPVRSSQFPQELGERIVWLSARQGQVADIALNPPHLGPLEVKLTLVGGEAGAQFFSPHAQVRDAIEAALPRLREMLADAGVTLGQAQVRDESFSRQGAPAQGDGHAGGGATDGDEQLPQAGGLGGRGARSLGQGLVDVFA